MTDQAPEPIKTFSSLQPHVIMMLREKFKQKAMDAYSVFLSSLAQIPCQQQQNDRSFMFFDTGLLWLQNGIDKIPDSFFNPNPTAPQQPVEVPVSTTETVTQSDTSEHTGDSA